MSVAKCSQPIKWDDVHIDDKSKVNIMPMPMALATMPKQAKQRPLDKFFTTTPKSRGHDLGATPSIDHAIRHRESLTPPLPLPLPPCHPTEDDSNDDDEEELPELWSLLAERKAERRNPPRPPEGPPPRRAHPSPPPPELLSLNQKNSLTYH
jgi:hypothetical protein